MTGENHKMGGLCIGVITAYYSMRLSAAPEIQDAIFFAPVFTTIGSLLPDIDVPNSTISRRFKRLSRFICGHTEHRQFTHSLVVPVLLVVIGLILGFWGFPPPAYAVFCLSIGYLFHMLQDTLTKGGVPWAYPLIRYRFSLLPMRTGSFFEWIITIAMVLAYSEILNYIIPA